MTDQNDQNSDPPMLPLEGTLRWFESGPEAVANNPLAALIVRVGMASNVLRSQLRLAKLARESKGIDHMILTLSSLSNAIAYTREGVKLARATKDRLRPLAESAGASRDLLLQIDELCGWNHPAAKTLKRGRNKLSFHLDHDLICRYLHRYERNTRLVWIENSRDGGAMFRLSASVLADALLDLDQSIPQQAVFDAAISKALSDVDSAIRLITDFFIAASFRFMRSINAERREIATAEAK